MNTNVVRHSIFTAKEIERELMYNGYSMELFLEYCKANGIAPDEGWYSGKDFLNFLGY